jgi:hypothetical protein
VQKPAFVLDAGIARVGKYTVLFFGLAFSGFIVFLGREPFEKNLGGLNPPCVTSLPCMSSCNVAGT